MHISETTCFSARPLKRTSAKSYLRYTFTLRWAIEEREWNFTSFFHFQKRTIDSSITTVAAESPPLRPMPIRTAPFLSATPQVCVPKKTNFKTHYSVVRIANHCSFLSERALLQKKFHKLLFHCSRLLSW